MAASHSFKILLYQSTAQNPQLCPELAQSALPVNGGSWKPLGPPGPARRLLVWCWRCSGGRAGVSRLESGRGSCGSSTARPPTRGAARWPDLQGADYLSSEPAGKPCINVTKHQRNRYYDPVIKSKVKTEDNSRPNFAELPNPSNCLENEV